MKLINCASQRDLFLILVFGIVYVTISLSIIITRAGNTGTKKFGFRGHFWGQNFVKMGTLFGDKILLKNHIFWHFYCVICFKLKFVFQSNSYNR